MIIKHLVPHSICRFIIAIYWNNMFAIKFFSTSYVAYYVYGVFHVKSAKKTRKIRLFFFHESFVLVQRLLGRNVKFKNQGVLEAGIL